MQLLDDADRHALALAAVILCFVLVGSVSVAVALGLAVRTFVYLSGV